MNPRFGQWRRIPRRRVVMGQHQVEVKTKDRRLFPCGSTSRGEGLTASAYHLIYHLVFLRDITTSLFNLFNKF